MPLCSDQRGDKDEDDWMGCEPCDGLRKTRAAFGSSYHDRLLSVSERAKAYEKLYKEQKAQNRILQEQLASARAVAASYTASPLNSPEGATTPRERRGTVTEAHLGLDREMRGTHNDDDGVIVYREDHLYRAPVMSGPGPHLKGRQPARRFDAFVSRPNTVISDHPHNPSAVTSMSMSTGEYKIAY